MFFQYCRRVLREKDFRFVESVSVTSGLLMANGEKRSQKGSQKRSDMTISEFPTPLVKNVYEAIKMNRKAKY